MTKRYYWLKLKDDFFTQKAIKKLRKIAGGDTFTIIYLKMMLLAMKSDGKIYFEGIENNFHEELALELDEEEENVQLTITYLINHKLMEEYQNEYYLPESIQNTGTESESAERVRKHRELLAKNGTKTLQCNGNVTTSNVDVTASNTEIEIDIEIEKDLDKEKDIDIEKKNHVQMYDKCTQNVEHLYTQNRLDKVSKDKTSKGKYSAESEEVLSYLNLKSDSNYRLIDSNLKLIDAILKKGYTKEDCFKVIDKKVAEWHGTDMQQYLRPLTIFSNKFDAYLNAPMAKKKTEFEQTQDALTNLYHKYKGEKNDEGRASKNIFDI